MSNSKSIKDEPFYVAPEDEYTIEIVTRIVSKNDPTGSNRSPGGFEKNYTYQIDTQLKAFKSGYQKET